MNKILKELQETTEKLGTVQIFNKEKDLIKICDRNGVYACKSCKTGLCAQCKVVFNGMCPKCDLSNFNVETVKFSFY